MRSSIVSIDGCRNGVHASYASGTLTDCTVTNCGHNGISTGGHGDVINIYGEKTKVTGNCTDTMFAASYEVSGLNVSKYCKFILHAPLTKESISYDNRGGRDWGGKNKILLFDDEKKEVRITYDGSPEVVEENYCRMCWNACSNWKHELSCGPCCSSPRHDVLILRGDR